jgi:hypothetical protein
VISDKGNVGIGAASPASTLEVAGTVQLRGSLTGTGLVVNSSGKVGVGTAADDIGANLDVNGTVRLNGLDVHDPGYGMNIIGLRGGTSTDKFLLFRYGGNTPAGRAGVIFSSFGTKDFFLDNDGAGLKVSYKAYTTEPAAPSVGSASTLLTIKENGSVGIGDEAPPTKLSVNGTSRFNTGGDYDVWIQGGNVTTGGDNRNLALLGYNENNGDKLVINFESEYASGTQIQGNAWVTGDLKVDGKLNASLPGIDLSKGINIGAGTMKAEKIYWVATRAANVPYMKTYTAAPVWHGKEILQISAVGGEYGKINDVIPAEWVIYQASSKTLIAKFGYETAWCRWLIIYI